MIDKRYASPAGHLGSSWGGSKRPSGEILATCAVSMYRNLPCRVERGLGVPVYRVERGLCVPVYRVERGLGEPVYRVERGLRAPTSVTQE